MRLSHKKVGSKKGAAMLQKDALDVLKTRQKRISDQPCRERKDECIKRPYSLFFNKGILTGVIASTGIAASARLILKQRPVCLLTMSKLIH